MNKQAISSTQGSREKQHEANFRTNFCRDPNRYKAKTRMVCRGKPVKSWIRKSSKHPPCSINFLVAQGFGFSWFSILENFPNLEFLMEIPSHFRSFQYFKKILWKPWKPWKWSLENLDPPQVLQSQQNHIFESFAAHPWSYKLALAGNNEMPSRWLVGFFQGYESDSQPKEKPRYTVLQDERRKLGGICDFGIVFVSFAPSPNTKLTPKP